ncbi:hypothetical protein H0H87_003064, partial [Tephrocybe sp. NHM501043]
TESPLESVQKFFDFNYPTLSRDKGHTKNTDTRTPGVFDAHLDPEYRLERVVELADIPADLQQVAQNALDNHTSLPIIGKHFSTKRHLEEEMKEAGQGSIQTEVDIERIYGRAVGGPCTAVAETLLYGRDSWSPGCLRWSFRPLNNNEKEDPVAKNHAVADGFLNIFNPSAKNAESLALSKTQQDVFDSFPVLAVWEFKNLNFFLETVGLATFEGVDSLVGGRFPWATCEFDGQCIAQHPQHAKTGSFMGWDAENPPSESYRKARESPEYRKRLNEKISVAQAMETREMAKKQNPKAKSKFGKRKAAYRIKREAALAKQNSILGTVIEESTDIDTEPILKGSKWSDFNETSPSMPLSSFVKSSRNLIQQVWSEAVRHDATFICINAGNIEIICIRDRLMKTLYVSDIIQVQKCKKYMQLHTGLIIAAVRDAEDRAREKKALNLRDVKDPEALFETYQHSLEDHDQTTPLDYNTFYQLYVASSPHNTTNRVCRGTLKIHGTLFANTFKGGDHPMLVIKNASTPQDIQTLRDEYETLCALNDADVSGIPHAFGFYYSPNKQDSKRSFAALVMEDMGVWSLSNIQNGIDARERKLQKVKRAKAKHEKYVCITTDEQNKRFELLLRSLHKAGYAHGNLTKENLILQHGIKSLDAGVSIVGFKHAVALEPLTRDVVIANEKCRLQNVLATTVMPKWYHEARQQGVQGFYLSVTSRLMLEEEERLNAAFKTSCDFNPPSQFVNAYVYPQITAPLTFYDKHVNKRLWFKKVTLVPSFASDLAQAAHRTFSNVKADGAQLPAVDDEFPTLKSKRIVDERGLIADARGVARRYQIETSFPASIMASMLFLHPNCPTWTDSVRVFESRQPRQYTYPALNEDYSPQFLAPYTPQAAHYFNVISREAWNAMAEDTREEICYARKRFRLLAVWQMFYVRREACRALKRLNTLTLIDNFPVPSFGALSSPCKPADAELPVSPDALSTAWGVSVANFVKSASPPGTKHADDTDSTTLPAAKQPLRRSLRIPSKIVASGANRPQVKKPGADITAESPPTVTPISERIVQWSQVKIPSHEESKPDDEEMATFILQHAWARAVERDSTFIVLHCGSYERIAFRHRSSRTLFISELIDVGKCSDPAYGAIHIGLFISIVKDALDRTRQLIDAESVKQSKKRKRPGIDSQDGRKRPKTRAAIAQEKVRKQTDENNFKTVSAEVAQRSLALLRIQHSHFNSSVPSSFLRHGLTSSTKVKKLIYKPSGTGDAHEGFIDVMDPCGSTMSLSKVVVKFAFEPGERQRLRHEFKVYEHLRSSGVSGIPYHFGLFKDVEGDTLALILTNGGTPLPDRKPQLNPHEYDPSFSVSSSERADFIRVLKSIHAAGVRHRDIRGDNLVVNEDGVVNIIDFDRASLKSREQTMQSEMEHLISTLDGDHAATGLEFVSRGSFRESGPPSIVRQSGWENSDDDSDRALRAVPPDLDLDNFPALFSDDDVVCSGDEASVEGESGSGGTVSVGEQ